MRPKTDYFKCDTSEHARHIALINTQEDIYYTEKRLKDLYRDEKRMKIELGYVSGIDWFSILFKLLMFFISAGLCIGFYSFVEDMLGIAEKAILVVSIVLLMLSVFLGVSGNE